MDYFDFILIGSCKLFSVIWRCINLSFQLFTVIREMVSFTSLRNIWFWISRVRKNTWFTYHPILRPNVYVFSHFPLLLLRYCPLSLFCHFLFIVFFGNLLQNPWSSGHVTVVSPSLTSFSNDNGGTPTYNGKSKLLCWSPTRKTYGVLLVTF